MLLAILIIMATGGILLNPVVAAETIYIREDGSIDPPVASIQRNGDIYLFTADVNDSIVVQANNIIIDGAGFTLQGPGGMSGTTAIALTGRENVTIQNMKITNFYRGIVLSGASNNNIYSNEITEITTNAIWIYDSSNQNDISDNNIKNNYEGITLNNASDNSIHRNNINNPLNGITLHYSSSNTIYGNDMTSSLGAGIEVEESNQNWVFSNNILDSRYGIWIQDSSANSIYHNDFVNNTEHAHCLNSTTVWDSGYPSGGNYWSGYIDVNQYSGPYQNETSPDGIWDHPYIINENNIDNYPLDPTPQTPLIITNGILGVVLRDVRYTDGIGVFTIKTDTGHPNPKQNVLFGGASENPWSSFTTIRVEDTLKEYVTSTHYKTASSGYTVEHLDAYSPIVTKVSDTTATISWTTAENLRVTLLIEIQGTALADTMVQVTVTIQNDDTIAHSVAVRHEWDLMIDGQDDSWIRVWMDPSNPQSWARNETDWTTPSFQFWETTNNPNNSMFSIYGSTFLPSVNPPPTVPDRIVYASFWDCTGTAYDYTPANRSEMDSAVLYYWNAKPINPGAQLSRTAYLTTVVEEELVAFARSTDSAGNIKSTFSTSDNIYVEGKDFPSNTNVTIYLIPDGENALPANAVATVSATTNSAGDLPVTLVKSPPFTPGDYDIWIDTNQNQMFDSGDVWSNQAGGISAFSVFQPANSPPYQPQLSITPSLAVENSDDLVANVVGPSPADPDGDEVTYTYRWLVKIGTGNFVDDEIAGRGNHNGNTIPASDTVVGDIWRVEVTPTDEHGTAGTSATATWQTVADSTNPVANAGPDQTVNEDTQVTFSGSASTDDVGIASYTWTFTDGSPQTLTGENPTYVFANPGTYTVTLNVTDTNGNWATDTVVITVSRVTPSGGSSNGGSGTPAPKKDTTEPVANAGSDKSVAVNDESISFDASGSSDNVGIVSYEWDFGDGTNGTGITLAHSYSDPGVYNVTLTVKDAAGNTQIDLITVTIQTDTDGDGEPDLTDADDDGDGIPDTWEIENGMDPLNALDAGFDSDHDGLTNLQEYQFGNDPNRSDAQVLSIIVIAAGACAATTATLVSLSGLGKALDFAISKLKIPESLKDFLQLYGEKLFETVDKAKLEALQKAPFITRGEILALVTSAFMAVLVFGSAEANGLLNFLDPSGFASFVPAALVSVCVVILVGEILEAICARACHVFRQFKLWMYGTIMFLISGLIFQVPFGSPGITRYQSGEISKKTKGLLVLTKMLLLTTLSMPFAALTMLGFDYIGNMGLKLTLMTACFSLIPLKPLVGKAIFEYNKTISITTLTGVGILFLSCFSNLLPNLAFLIAGAVSACLGGIALYQLRK